VERRKEHVDFIARALCSMVRKDTEKYDEESEILGGSVKNHLASQRGSHAFIEK
jgi:hypothetical protein